MRFLLITGLPGTGKSTLAGKLAARYGAPLISKDLIKEPLLDVLGAGSAQHSRLLSDASFTVLFAVARALAAANINFLLEGNFRPGEHDAVLAGLGATQLTQLLCRIDEPTRLARLAERRALRHPGHRDTEAAAVARRSSDAFLDLPGERLTFDGSELSFARQLDALDRWWRED